MHKTPLPCCPLFIKFNKSVGILVQVRYYIITEREYNRKEVKMELAIAIISLITAIINLTITIIRVIKLKDKNED